MIVITIIYNMYNVCMIVHSSVNKPSRKGKLVSGRRRRSNTIVNMIAYTIVYTTVYLIVT